MPRLYEHQCKECTAYAVLNGYCRQCGCHSNPTQTGVPDDAPPTDPDETADDDFHEWDTPLEVNGGDGAGGSGEGQ